MSTSPPIQPLVAAVEGCGRVADSRAGGGVWLGPDPDQPPLPQSTPQKHPMVEVARVMADSWMGGGGADWDHNPNGGNGPDTFSR